MLRTIAMLLLISTGALASPRKLMIAGDSHCDHSGVGYNTIPGTWRKEFQDLVAAAGYQIDYVGGTAAWGAGNCAPNQIDCDNACYNGASLLTMDIQNGLPGGSIPTQLGILKPDDLLLMGGNNEIPLYTAPVAAQHLRDLLLHNWAQSPSTRTFLAKPTDTCNGGQRTGLMVPFNSLIDGVVDEVRAACPGVSITVFDMYPIMSCAGTWSNTGPTGSSDYVNDNGHWSINGNHKAALAWFSVWSAATPIEADDMGSSESATDLASVPDMASPPVDMGAAGPVGCDGGPPNPKVSCELVWEGDAWVEHCTGNVRWPGGCSASGAAEATGSALLIGMLVGWLLGRVHGRRAGRDGGAL